MRKTNRILETREQPLIMLVEGNVENVYFNYLKTQKETQHYIIKDLAGDILRCRIGEQSNL